MYNTCAVGGKCGVTLLIGNRQPPVPTLCQWSIVLSSIKMFSDDTKLWATISDMDDKLKLQDDLRKIERLVGQITSKI